jgi:catechol 2,3-dioxygenase-like lactoylglutathione lyase family enzyme
MLDIKRAGHSTLTTPDIEKTVDYFTRIVGLSLAAREKNRVILATKSGPEAIVLEKGSEAEAPRLSLQVAPGSGIGEALVFTDPKGTTIEVFSDFNFAPEDNNFNGVMPIKFGHIAYQCPDVKGIVKFYCDVLGFRVSDWRSDFFAFLRCSRDHHTVNFLRNDKTAIHHIAFEVRDWSDIKRACDLLARNNIKLTWGPIRHIIGHNIAIYHKNPDGIVIEFFTDLDQMHDEDLGYFEPRPWHQDRPQRPKVWGDDTASNWWGPMSHGSPQHASALAQPAAAEPAVHHGLQGATRKPALAEARVKQTQKKSRASRKPRRG